MARKKTVEAQSKAVAFRKANAEREMRLAKASSAAEAIGTLAKGQDVFVLTFGQFSLIDALVAILDQTGPADVTISTWTAADAHLQRSAELIESAAIRSFRMIVDRFFETRQPAYCFQLRRLFGQDSIRAIRTHAKFMLIRNESWDLVVRTSMNLNENPRLENIEISESGPFADWFQAIADAVFDEVAVGEKRSKLLDFPELPDDFPFREIDAPQIPRENLHEAKTTHTVKKL
jgi:hypothetical protein